MSVTEHILLLDESEFWIIASISIAAALAGFYFAFHFLRRARIIEDTPTANIHSAHQGYVEIVGTAQQMDGEPTNAPSAMGAKRLAFSMPKPMFFIFKVVLMPLIKPFMK